MPAKILLEVLTSKIVFTFFSWFSARHQFFEDFGVSITNNFSSKNFKCICSLPIKASKSSTFDFSFSTFNILSKLTVYFVQTHICLPDGTFLAPNEFFLSFISKIILTLAQFCNYLIESRKHTSGFMME